MIYGLYNSAAGMMTMEYRQDVLANNIANSDTVGFKRDIAVFAERLPAELAGLRQGASAEEVRGLSGGMWLGRTHTDFGEGGTVQTGGRLDVALEGPGFLTFEVDGRPVYTRDGRMTLTPNGQLVSAVDGSAVVGRGGVPILLSPLGNRETIQIDEDGRVFQDGLQVGQLQLVDFEEYGALTKIGAQRFAAAEGAGFAAAALVRAGYLETSGVQPLPELVSMIEASRAYEINARMISLQDQSIGQLISTVLRA